MLELIANKISKVAYEMMVEASPGLSVDDVKLLRKSGPELLKDIQQKVKDKEEKPFKGLSLQDKRILLAYLVYFRQNITTESKDNPNQEDAAKIMHKDVFKEDDKDTKEKIDKQIKKQLSKIGISIKEAAAESNQQEIPHAIALKKCMADPSRRACKFYTYLPPGATDKHTFICYVPGGPAKNCIRKHLD